MPPPLDIRTHDPSIYIFTYIYIYRCVCIYIDIGRSINRSIKQQLNRQLMLQLMINQTYAAPRDNEIYRGTDHDKPMMMMMYRWFFDEAFAKQPHKPHRINPIIIVLFADQVESISQTIDRPTLFMVSVHILISLCSESVKFYTVIYYTYIYQFF